MKSSKILLKNLPLIGFLGFICLFGQTNGQCKTVDELDACAYKSAFLVNRNIPMPKTTEQLQRNARESLGCMKDFSNTCVIGTPKMYLSKIYNAANKSLEDHCTNEDRSKEFLETLSCLDTDEKVERVRKCSDKHILMLEKAVDVEIGQRAGPMCCTFEAYKNCILDTVKEVCSEEDANYFLSIIMEYADELVTVTCQRFSSLDKCASNLNSEFWGAIKPIIDAAEPGPHNYKTSIPIMYRMIEKFIKKSKTTC
ncbi:hypothetical protein BLOT_006123 [Blomia tropicalis]|nr:hypothetical protein BLOT_006123 [Blomia tropicalis]